MIKISTLYVYIKKVYHYNKWSLKINLFTKVFIKRSVLIFGRTQPFFLRLCTFRPTLLDSKGIALETRLPLVWRG